MKILAMDVGKSKTVGYLVDTTTGEAAFETVVTAPTVIRRWVRKQRPDRVVMEIGPLAGWIHDVVRAAGVGDIEVANVNHEAWRWRSVRRKNDRMDAAKLADLSAAGQLPTVHLPAAAVRQWRQLIAYRAKLVDRRTAIKNSLRSILAAVGVAAPAGRACWKKETVTWMRGESRPLKDVPSEDLWRGELGLELDALEAVEKLIGEVEEKLASLGEADERVRRLQTVPGVGPRLAEMMVALVDRPGRFRSGRQVGSYLGLVPRQWQSGASDRRGHISRQGCRLARKLLVEVAWMTVRFNPHFRQMYERLRGGSPARTKVAIVGVARHLAVTLWAMLRDGTVWRPPTPHVPRTHPSPGRRRRKDAASATATTTTRRGEALPPHTPPPSQRQGEKDMMTTAKA
jgi:transposase